MVQIISPSNFQKLLRSKLMVSFVSLGRVLYRPRIHREEYAAQPCAVLAISNTCKMIIGKDK